MKIRRFIFIPVILISVLFTGCFSEKKSPFYNSEWLMQNVDKDNQPYFHQLFLKPDHTVTLQVSYVNSTNIIVWTGTYKINSKKIIFNFTQCTRFEDGKPVGNYTSGKLIKYYTGEYLYSVALLVDEKENEKYHLQLIRPQNYFYDVATDIFENELEEFIKVN